MKLSEILTATFPIFLFPGFILINSNLLPNVCATSTAENQSFQTDNGHTTQQPHTEIHQNEKTNRFSINKSKKFYINSRNNNNINTEKFSNDNYYQSEILQHHNRDVSYETKNIDNENIYNKNCEYYEISKIFYFSPRIVTRYFLHTCAIKLTRHF